MNDTKSQRERFEQAALELSVDLDEEKLRQALRKIAPDPKKKAGGDKGTKDAS